METYINFRIIENAKSEDDAEEKLHCDDISETHELSDRILKLTPELEKVLIAYCKKHRKQNILIINKQ